MKDFKLSSLIIEALLNHGDDSEFILNYQEKIYEKYGLPNKLRKLIPKSFYNAEISASHMSYNIQGFDTRLMLYDIGWFFSRFRFQDLCDSFPKDYRINLGFTPLDMLRYRYHGKLNTIINNFEINFYKERNFQRFDPKFRITISQIEFIQKINDLQCIIDHLNITKFPSKQFETQIFKVPLIETILRLQYNNAEINNHYRDLGCLTIEEYMKNISNYSTRNISIEILLHIPSLKNNDDLLERSKSELLSYFIKKAKVTVFHFQKSYMRMIYDFICEYIFKKDYSVKENVAQYPINYEVSGRALISDLVAIFSDFDYNMTFEEERVDLLGNTKMTSWDFSFIPPEQILENYNGIIMSFENFFMMSKMEILNDVIQIKDKKQERIKFRVSDAESR